MNWSVPILGLFFRLNTTTNTTNNTLHLAPLQYIGLSRCTAASNPYALPVKQKPRQVGHTCIAPRRAGLAGAISRFPAAQAKMCRHYFLPVRPAGSRPAAQPMLPARRLSPSRSSYIPFYTFAGRAVSCRSLGPLKTHPRSTSGAIQRIAAQAGIYISCNFPAAHFIRSPATSRQ